VIAVLCGGVGAAKMLAGLQAVLDPGEIVAVVNTGDDTELHGLYISPDLDTITYTLSGAANPITGWGLEGDTFRAMEALDRFGAPTWFRLGDADLATHLYRTGRMREGATLSEATADISRAFGLRVRLIPMSDDPVRTRLRVAGGQEVAFQDYFVKLGHSVEVEEVSFAGAERSEPAPGVLRALADAEIVVVAPSNPIVSIGPILSVPGVLKALTSRRDSVVAVSPIIAGAALKGPADRLLAELGHEASAVGVARFLSSWVGTIVIDQADENLADVVRAAGLDCRVAPTVMKTPETAAALARVVLGTTGAVARPSGRTPAVPGG
jgi:LPPG:FO 2-phospho-L-lactate transferase